jgi:MAternally-affected-uncoordination protein
MRHKPLIHALLGMYAMSMNFTDAAEAQLATALRVIILNTQSMLRKNLAQTLSQLLSESILFQIPTACTELRIMTSLNLAIVYLRNKREKELNDLLAKLNPEALPSVYVIFIIPLIIIF